MLNTVMDYSESYAAYQAGEISPLETQTFTRTEATRALASIWMETTDPVFGKMRQYQFNAETTWGIFYNTEPGAALEQNRGVTRDYDGIVAYMRLDAKEGHGCQWEWAFAPTNDAGVAPNWNQASSFRMLNGHPYAGVVAVSDSGTSTGSNTSTTLNDTNKNWPLLLWASASYTNGYKAYGVKITAGTGVGQERVIASNPAHTATQLTVEIAWTITPDATSTYQIIGNVPVPASFEILGAAGQDAELRLMSNYDNSFELSHTMTSHRR